MRYEDMTIKPLQKYFLHRAYWLWQYGSRYTSYPAGKILSQGPDDDPSRQLAEDDCDRNDWDADWYNGEAEQLEALAAVIKNSSAGGGLNKGAYTN